MATQAGNPARAKGNAPSYSVWRDAAGGVTRGVDNHTGLTPYSAATADVVAAAILTELGSNAGSVAFSADTHSVAASTAVPANIGVQAVQGTLLRPASGQTLTINGTLDAGPYQVFDISAGGTVSLAVGSAPRVRPEWFGAKGDGTTDDTNAVNDALTSSAPGSVVELLGRGYYTPGGIVVPSYRHLVGAGRYRTTVSSAGAGLNAAVVSLPAGTVGNSVSHLTVRGQNAVANLGNQKGVALAGVDQTAEDLWIDGCAFCGMYVIGTVRPAVRHLKVTNTLWTGAAGGVGFWVFRANLDAQLYDILIDGADCHGLIFDSGTVTGGAYPNIGATLAAIHIKNFSRNTGTPGNGLYIKGGRGITGAGILIENGGYPNNASVVSAGVVVAEDANGQISEDVSIDAVVRNVNYQAASAWSTQNVRIRVTSRNVGMAQPGLGAGGVFAATLGYSNQDRSPHNATGTPTIVGGAITGVTITNRGDSIAVVPPAVFAGDGVGAAGTVNVVLDSMTVARAGSTYDPLTPPAVTVSGGGGSGVVAHSVVNQYGGVSALVIDNPGTGPWTGQPTVAIDPPPGGGETALGIALFAVDSVTIQNGGTGYTTATVTMIPGAADCTDNVIDINHTQDSGVGEFDYGAQFATANVGGGYNNNKRNQVHFRSNPTPGTALMQTVGSNVPTSGQDANQVIQDGARVSSAGAPPTVVAGVSAGTGAVASIDAGSTDQAGHITLATGTGTSAGDRLFTTTFAKPYANPPIVTISPTTTASASVGAAVYWPSVTTTGFAVVCANTPAVSYANYGWTYHVVAQGN